MPPADAKAARPQRVVFVVESNGVNPSQLRPVGLQRGRRTARPENAKLDEFRSKDRTPPAARTADGCKDRLTLVQGLSGRIAAATTRPTTVPSAATPANQEPGETVDSALGDVLPRHLPARRARIPGGADNNVQLPRVGRGPGKALPDGEPGARHSNRCSAASPTAAGRRVRPPDQPARLHGGRREAPAALAGEERRSSTATSRRSRPSATGRASSNATSDDLSKHAPKLGEKVDHAQSPAGSTPVRDRRGGPRRRADQRAHADPRRRHPALPATSPGSASRDCTRSATARALAGRRPRTASSNSAGSTPSSSPGLAKKLEKRQGGDGTMLDNTVIVYLSDSGEAHHRACGSGRWS